MSKLIVDTLRIWPAAPEKPRDTVPMNVPVTQMEDKIKPLTKLAVEIMGANCIEEGPAQ